MTNYFTELQVKQMNSAISVLGEAMTRIIKLQGTSNLTLSLESSAHELEAIMKEFDGSQIRSDDSLSVAINREDFMQIQQYTNEQITEVFTDLEKVYERKVDELEQMDKDNREDEIDYAILDQEVEELRNMLAMAESSATLESIIMRLQAMLNTTTSGSIADAICKFVVKGN